MSVAEDRIRPIETRFGGVLFRSRLEARWCVFWDSRGVPWEYEKEGYELPSGRYLPDFWLPQHRCWVEIKGQKPTEHELDLLHDLAGTTGTPAYLFWGTPGAWKWQRDVKGLAFVWMPTEKSWWPEEREQSSALGLSFDSDHAFTECIHCGQIGIEWQGRAERLACGCWWYSEKVESWLSETKERIRKGHCLGSPDATLEEELRAINCGHVEMQREDIQRGVPPRETMVQMACGSVDTPRLRAAYEKARSARFEFGEQG